MIPRRMVRLVLERDGEVCQLVLPGCTYLATVADHRANRGAGGSSLLDSPVNLVAACVTCNGLKETVHGDALQRLKDRGVRVMRAATNAKTLTNALAMPVQYRDGRWYLLDAVGGRQHIREVF